VLAGAATGIGLISVVVARGTGGLLVVFAVVTVVIALLAWTAGQDLAIPRSRLLLVLPAQGAFAIVVVWGLFLGLAAWAVPVVASVAATAPMTRSALLRRRTPRW